MKRIITLFLALMILIPVASISATKSKGFQFSMSLGLGTGIPIDPDVFESNYDPSFGAIADVAVQWSLLQLSTSFDYNFFYSNGVEPDDLNILTIFLNLKIKPSAKTSVRPYILIGAGFFRSWIVDLDIAENTTGYQGGVGVELDISKTQTLFIDAKQVFGRTRETSQDQSNTSYIAIRIGVTFLF